MWKLHSTQPPAPYAYVQQMYIRCYISSPACSSEAGDIPGTRIDCEREENSSELGIATFAVGDPAKYNIYVRIQSTHDTFCNTCINKYTTMSTFF